MSDDDTSGNRWENHPDENPTNEIETVKTPEPDVSTTELQPSNERWGAAMRTPRALAGAAAVAIALTGISGFAAGRATAGDTVVPVSAGFDAGQAPGAGQADSDGQVDGQRPPRGPRGSVPELAPDASGTDDSGSDSTGGADAGDSSAT